MLKKWHSTNHPISDIREWNNNNTLIVQPDYQRREVWGDAAKVMLIDSILSGIPMPKIFVSSIVRDGRTYRTVIDGQQRISTILAFLDDGFPLVAPYAGEYLRKKFSELPENIRDQVILSYDIDFNEGKGLTEDELREVYSRVNKYLVALNRQELRKADFPGEFLKVAESLANDEFFEDSGMFNATARRRSLDVEYICELLGGLLLGITEKKDAIDSCCIKYQKWDSVDKEKILTDFGNIIEDIEKIFSNDYAPIKKTRWKQKADFYSLFLAINDLRKEGFSLTGDLHCLQDDFYFLNENIAPTSEVPTLSKYAIYCVSQANSSASRNWRANFLKAILRGSYARSMSDSAQKNVVFTLAVDVRFSFEPDWSGDGCPPVNTFSCPICKKMEDASSINNSALIWDPGTNAFQFTNARWAHEDCVKGNSNISVIHGADFVNLIEEEDENQ